MKLPEEKELFADSPEIIGAWGIAEENIELKALVDENTIVGDKKPFIVDFKNSQGPYLVSTDSPPRLILDASGQMATWAVGANSNLLRPLLARNEIFHPHPSHQTYLNWDVKKAFEEILLEESGLPYIALLNSGAEAIEAVLISCQKKYPDRRKIFAFEGSFHGRTCLAIHATHNEAKRKPYDFEKDLVQFFPFPDYPECRDGVFPDQGVLVDRENKTLRLMELALQKEKPLAVIVEPMQSEGGDRYASARFFRSLRLLTRKYDTALVFDEVQTGFCLGGPFFWHKNFSLVKSDGSPDFPDALAVAKKAQVGVALSYYPIETQVQTSMASIYRGYLNAFSVKNSDTIKVQKKIWEGLTKLEKKIDRSHFQNPRSQGYAFSFDVETPAILEKLLQARFKHGLLFFNAGNKTARFRLLSDLTDAEIDHIFEKIEDILLEKPVSKTFRLPRIPAIIPESLIPHNLTDYVNTPREKWDGFFRSLIKGAPQILKNPAFKRYTLEKLSSLSALDLWSRVQSGKISPLEFVFNSSRRFGFVFTVLTTKDLLHLRDQIQALEEAAYEPARRDDPETFISLSKDQATLILGAFSDDGVLAGISLACSPSYFKEKIKLIREDSALHDPRALYSMDVSIHPRFQGQGLGLRMKCEQIMEAQHRGVSVLRSRNRFPEASAMIRVNTSLSSVILKKDHESYEGHATAYYQSLTITPPEHPPYTTTDLGALKHKLTLCMFSSPAFHESVNSIKKQIPNTHAHFYFTSGRSEQVDKMVKILRSKRPKARIAISFKNDFFGDTTAASRSLGGVQNSFFSWPVIEELSLAALKHQLTSFEPDEVLGVFIQPVHAEPHNKKSRNESELIEILKYCKSIGLPVIFEETESAFYQFSKDRFFYANDRHMPDALLFYPGHQIGIIATTQALFFDKPMTMISTWDGDEHSLRLACLKLQNESHSL